MNRYFLCIAAAITLLTAACTRQQTDVEEPVIPVTGITHNLPATLELLVGTTLTFEAAVEPAEATNQTVTWSTSDDHVVTVNSAGELTAIASGTATITATTNDGSYTATCTVTIVAEGITMTTLASEVLIGIIPLETDVFFDWGDGTESNINDNSDNWGVPSYGQLFVFSHYYSRTSEHKITITGNVSHLYCRDNQITTLDVSNNAAIRFLYCDNNQLTTSALDDLFKTLPEKPILQAKQGPYPDSPFTIYIHNNPGTSDCDVNIAFEKGWRVFPPLISGGR